MGGHLSLHWVAQSPIQSDIEHFWWWSANKFSGETVSSHHPHPKKCLPFVGFKLLPLILSLQFLEQVSLHFSCNPPLNMERWQWGLWWMCFSYCPPEHVTRRRWSWNSYLTLTSVLLQNRSVILFSGDGPTEADPCDRILTAVY